MNQQGQFSRRSILRGAAYMGALGAVGAPAEVFAESTPAKPVLAKGSTIVFQGDSITDAGRKRNVKDANRSAALGRGYPALIAGQLLGTYTDLELRTFNRGISGNKVPDLAGRWQADALDLKPDVLSILVGVNDLWHTFAFGSKYKGTVKDYEDGYRALIKRTTAALPACRVVICEPFTTRTSNQFKPLADYAAVAKGIAEEFKLTFVPFQSVFNKALKSAPGGFWLSDGVHPTSAGHGLMCQAWREAVGA